MTANPWDKFFWNDWENDPALKLCSFAAQGLWMRILCICAKADPKGYLVVAGQLLSPTDLASLVGKPEPEVETLLRELAKYGVFSTDRTGRIYSRRMVRDLKKARLASEYGKRGGNPKLSNEREISLTLNPPLKPDDKPQNPVPIPLPKQKVELNSFIVGGRAGKKDGVTIQDPSERIARFQKKLAQELGKDGWVLVAAASDANAPDHGRALEICKNAATKIGKGWPRNWPGETRQ